MEGGAEREGGGGREWGGRIGTIIGNLPPSWPTKNSKLARFWVVGEPTKMTKIAKYPPR